MSIKQKLMLFHIILFACTAFFSLNAGLNVYLIANNQPVGIDYKYLPICTENAEEKCLLPDKSLFEYEQQVYHAGNVATVIFCLIAIATTVALILVSASHQHSLENRAARSKNKTAIILTAIMAITDIVTIELIINLLPFL